jgi:thiol-disulfide isomerase/thioredoxin
MHDQAGGQSIVRDDGRRAALCALVMAALFTACGRSRLARLEPVDEARFPDVVAGAKGNVVLVNFWATWCAPCRDEMPALAKLEAAVAPRGFRLLTVSADEPEQEPAALAFLQSQNLRPPAYIKRARSDEAFIGLVDPGWTGALPASFLYDRKGRKVRSFIGEVKIADLEKAIRELL